MEAGRAGADAVPMSGPGGGDERTGWGGERQGKARVMAGSEGRAGRALDACLLTAEEMEQPVEAWEALDDYFPPWEVVETAESAAGV